MFNLDEDGHNTSSDSSSDAAKKGYLTQGCDIATTNSGQPCPGANLDVELISSSRASAQVESNPGESSPPDNALRSSDSSALLAYLGASSAFSRQPSIVLQSSQVLFTAGPLQSSAVIGVSHAASPISRAAVLVRQPQPSNRAAKQAQIWRASLAAPSTILRVLFPPPRYCLLHL